MNIIVKEPMLGITQCDNEKCIFRKLGYCTLEEREIDKNGLCNSSFDY